MKLPTSKGSTPWLNDRTIYLTKHGSHAYGTARPTSDLDIKGVAIAPVEYYHGFLHKFEQAEFREPADAVVYELRKFLHLASNCNPNIIEVLWTDESDHLKVTPLGERLLEARSLFLSKKARFSFAGYAISQLKRIKTHRRWLLDPPKSQPQRADFGLPDTSTIPKDQMNTISAAVQSKLDGWQFNWSHLDDADRIAIRGELQQILVEMKLGSAEERWAAAARNLGVNENYLELLKSERSYLAAKKNWRQYNEWCRNRNPERAALEQDYGYDCKHGAHLVRLLRMGQEILETGKVIVRRPDAEELLAIRDGDWSYDRLIEWAEEQEEVLDQLYKSSDILPHKPDRNKLDKLCIELVEASWGES